MRAPAYRARSFKTQQRGYVEVDVLLGELDSRTNLSTAPDESSDPGTISIDGPSAYRRVSTDSLERR